MKRHETIINLDKLEFHEWSNGAYPDVSQYPDSGKTLVSHRWNSGGEEDETLRFILREGEARADCWAGEQ
jgi:hypothetical protein